MVVDVLQGGLWWSSAVFIPRDDAAADVAEDLPDFFSPLRKYSRCCGFVCC